MADHKQPDTHKITPRDVTPDDDTPAGRARRERDVTNDRGMRPDPEVVEADGGDISGVAGGGIDSKVSGLGSRKDSH